MLLVTVLVGCIVETAPPAVTPEPVIPAPQPEVARVAEPAVVVPAPRVPPAVEVGYEHCCGNDVYRLEISCGYSELRCYERAGDGWVRTYGRFCKEQLGTACYLNGCDDRCQ